MAIESTPVSGVEIRKESVAPFEAPFFLKDMAVGITPHEQSGKGTPNKAAVKTDLKPFLPKYFMIWS